MRHREYGSKEKLFSIDKNIFQWIESQKPGTDLAKATHARPHPVALDLMIRNEEAQ